MATSKLGQVEAKCPFYRASDKIKISCEGITDDCTINLIFNSRTKRNLHRDIFCDARYQYCEIYRMLEEKYAD
jgi:hypothetical protein